MSTAKETILKYCANGFLAVITVWLLSSCGGSDKSTAWSPDLTIEFPISGSSTTGFSRALVYGDSIDIRGTARDPKGDGITSLYISLANGAQIEGVIDPIDPNNRSLGVNWVFKNVPLDQIDANGNLQINVHARNHKNSLAKTLKIKDSLHTRSVALINPVFIANDQRNNRQLIVDYTQRMLISVDISTGKRTIISGYNVGEGPHLVNPASVVVNSEGTEAFLMDQSNATLFRIDMANGNRTVVSNNTLSHGPVLQNPYSMALVEASNLVILVDLAFEGIYAIDLTSGARSILSSEDVGQGPKITAPWGISYNASLPDKILVTNNQQDEPAVFKIDLTTGDRSVLSGLGLGLGESFKNPTHLYIDSLTNSAFVIEGLSHPNLIAVDLDTGDRLPVSNLNKGNGLLWVNPNGVSTTSESGAPIYVLDSYAGTLTSADRRSGDRTILYDDAIGTGPRPFIILDADKQGSYGEALNTATNKNALFEVDLKTGDRHIVYQADNSAPLPYFQFDNLKLDPVYNRLIATFYEETKPYLISIDLDSKQETILSNEVVNNFCLNAAQQKLYTADSQAIIEIDLRNGDRTVISSFIYAKGTGPEIPGLDACVVDQTNEQMYLIYDKNYLSDEDEEVIFLYTIDLSTGNRSVVSSSIHGSGPEVDDATAMDLDVNRNTVLVTVDESGALGAGSVISINLTNGNRTIISDKHTGNGPLLKLPTSIGIDPQNNIAYIGGFDSLYMMNLAGCAEDNNADGYADEGCDRVVISQ